MAKIIYFTLKGLLINHSYITRKQSIYVTDIPAFQNTKWKISVNDPQGLSIPYDAIPFLLLGKEVRVCHHGKDRDSARKNKYKEQLIDVREFYQ